MIEEFKPTIPNWLGKVLLGTVGVVALAIIGGFIAMEAAKGWNLGGLIVAGIEGFLVAVGFILVSMIIFISLMSWRDRPEVLEIHRTKSEATIDEILNNLEADRQATIVRLRRWKWAFMAAGAPLGLAWTWLRATFSGLNIDRFEVSILFVSGVHMLMGAIFGYFAGEFMLNRGYQRHYKAKVLPMLAAQVGGLGYRQPNLQTERRLQGLKLFYGRIVTEAADEIFGTYRDLPTSIMRLRLVKPIKAKGEVDFVGFLARVELRNRLLGTTVVLKHDGPFAGLVFEGGEWGLQPVHLEDPVFGRAFRVYSNDQVMARVLLTPDFMEAFRTLGGLALAEDRNLTLALPRAGAAQLFNPPSYQDPAGNRAILTALLADIRSVLSVVDIVIDLDAATRRQAGPRVSSADHD